MSQMMATLPSLPREDSPLPAPTGSSEQRAAPRLGHHTLTILLGLMALVPAMTIGVLWNILPPVAEGRLEASAWGQSLPDPAIYDLAYRQRPEVSGGQLVVRNEGSEPWTHINIWVNGLYQLYDLDPLPAGEERVYPLDRFVTRFGARYELRCAQLRSALVYARLPKGNRATRSFEFAESGLPVGQASPGVR